jgi:hypothetical protein
MDPTGAQVGGEARTVGVVLGLLVFGALLAGLALSAIRTRTLPAESALADWLEIDSLPFDLEPDRALRQGRELLVTWIDPEAPQEAPRPEQPKEAKKKPKGHEERREEFDWSAIAIGPEGTPPVEVLAVRYGQGSDERIEELFEPPPTDEELGGEPMVIGPEGGKVAMDRGRLRWGDYEVAFVHERELEQGGTFRDVIRANLSLPDRPLVLYARWPRGLPASEERMVDLLAALKPRT